MKKILLFAALSAFFFAANAQSTALTAVNGPTTTLGEDKPASTKESKKDKKRKHKECSADEKKNCADVKKKSCCSSKGHTEATEKKEETK